MESVIDTPPALIPTAHDAMMRAIDADLEGRDHHYPNGALFVDSALPGAGDLVVRYSLAGRPVVLVGPDGTERIINARRAESVGVAAAASAVARALLELTRAIRDRASRKRDRQIES